MIEENLRGNCEDCVDRSRSIMIGLARQYIAGDHWLRDREHGMPGDYSLPVIHAIGRRIDIERPHRDIRGPFLRDDPFIEADESLLSLTQSILAERALHPDAVKALRDIGQRRNRSYDMFLNKGKRYWDEQAKKAKPFLDQLAYPDRSQPDEKRWAFQRVYWLDQGAFIIAKSALFKCTGPWFRLCPFGEKFQRFHIPQQQGPSY